MTQAIRVLIIDDDEELVDTLCTHFSNLGMQVQGLNDPRRLGASLPDTDIVLCDVNFPTESGFSIAARLRLMSRVGIIMLTARSQPEDRLLGLSLGVDHYVVKPVNFGELELMIRNLYRRLQEGGDSRSTDASDATGATWHFDTSSWQLTAPNGKGLRLTLAEYKFMECLLAEAGEVVSRDDLLSGMGRPPLDTYRRNLDVTISRLRRKVERICEEQLPILAAWGRGYVFTGRCTTHG